MTTRDVTWALDFARAYRKDDTQAGLAFRILADEILELRGEAKALRALVGEPHPVSDTTKD